MDSAVFPFVVRIAGLPAEAMAPFGSDACAGPLRRLRELELALERARAALAERLYTAVHDSPAEQRRPLLAMKRDSFNGRSLGKYRRRPDWPQLLGLAGPAAELVLGLEAQIEECREEFAPAYRRQRERERRHLLQLAGDRRFLRGIALSSVALLTNLQRLDGSPAAEPGRREKRLETSLARYASRAALKLSPFSTLTVAGLGVVAPGVEGLQWLDGRWRERSLVCLRRYLLDQVADLLARHAPVRERLPVALNDTVERLGEDRFRFLRPGFWDYDPAARAFQHHKIALVKVKLRGPGIRWLIAKTAAERPSYRDLAAELAAELPEEPPGKLRQVIDQLLRIGLLRLVWPWTSDDLQLEHRMLAYLESLPADDADDADDGLDRLAAALRRIVAVLPSFPQAESPTALVAEIGEAVFTLRQTAAELAGLGRAGAGTPADRCFHEDVLVAPAEPGTALGEVVRLALPEAAEVLRNVEPLARLANLQGTRHDFLHALSAFACRRWPDREEVGLLDLFDAAHALFQEYVSFEAAARREPAAHATAWNPLGLPEVERLQRARLRVAGQVASCFAADGEQVRLDGDALSRLLDEAEPDAGRRDFCAFVQPTDGSASEWVLNALFEGGGRMSSRYTAVLDEDARRAWSAYFTRYSIIEQDGGPAELVDLFCPFGHVLNLHVAQTHRILEIPGDSCGLPAERLLRLCDVRVRLGGPQDLPRLVDGEGRRLLPVHVGGLIFRFMPDLLQFLTLFGPGEIHFQPPRLEARREGGLSIWPRHRIGNVVFSRRTWGFAAAPLRAALDGLSGAAAFLAIDRWRRERNLPRQVFLLEPLAEGVDNPKARPKWKPKLKPQSIDFGSPLFVEIFRSAVEMDVSHLLLAEALPAAADLPECGDGLHRALELQLDSFGFPFS